MQGVVVFTPVHRTARLEGTVYVYNTIVAQVIDGVMVHMGTPGLSLPASTFGMLWKVNASPVGFSNVLQSYPGDIISIGD